MSRLNTVLFNVVVANIYIESFDFFEVTRRKPGTSNFQSLQAASICKVCRNPFTSLAFLRIFQSNGIQGTDATTKLRVQNEMTDFSV